MSPVELCLIDNCRRLRGHSGGHEQLPGEAWDFLADKDKNKLDKAGYATPRGGAKGAYQNHVLRSSRVIIPYERLESSNLSDYAAGGYVIRLFPEQYFAAPGVVRPEFQVFGAPVVGEDAFVLYRTHSSFESLPPLPNWQVRGLTKNGAPVTRRGVGVEDTGHYVLRMAALGPGRPARSEGPPQGIFAPEYAPAETNYLCQCVLAWLTVHTYGSPYVATQARHLEAILKQAGLLDMSGYELRGVLRHGLTACPLCLRIIRYEQLHELVNFEEGSGLVNAAIQVEGATRSTDVNLFHLTPLVYGSLQHVADSVAWGHANCNTRLGQRHCYSLDELQHEGLKLGILHEERLETFGWMSPDFQMIRSPNGAVWIQLCDDMTPAELAGEPPLRAPVAEDEAELPTDGPLEEAVL
ncbi:hypothetical protein [Blastococcus sp. SYSU D00813]